MKCLKTSYQNRFIINSLQIKKLLSLIKSMNQQQTQAINIELDLLEVPLKDEYIPELSKLLATAYLVNYFLNVRQINNPFFKGLGFTIEQLTGEFAQVFKDKLYPLMFVLVDKKRFQEGEVKFVSCGCLGDIVDFFPKGQYSYEKTYFDKVPTLSLARQFMRQKSLKPLWEKYKPQRGQWIFGSTFFINPEYQGKQYIHQVFYLLTLIFLKAGYQNFAFNAANEIIKKYLRQYSLSGEEVFVDNSNMEIQDTKYMPFKNTKLYQSCFELQGSKNKEILEVILQKKLKAKL